MSILIVDDDPTIRDLATLLLTQAGFNQIEAAESPAAAFEMLGINPLKPGKTVPDVILMDIMMPEMDGIEACARIKLDQRFADVPVIMVTTLDDVEHLKKAFMAGATDYMNKPIRSEELLARVRSAHRLKRELDRRKMREAELKALAESLPSNTGGSMPDAETGLLDEAALLNMLGWALARPKRGGILTVVAPDAWDAYAMRYGKEKAAAAIAQVAMAIKKQSSLLADQLFKLDNGRFALFCPYVDKAKAQKNSEHWQAAITALNIPHAYSPSGSILSLSAGIVDLIEWQKSRADLLAEALSRLAQAERSGGKAICMEEAKGK